jgi:hypothetical protein
MPVNFSSFDTPTTKAAIDRRRAMAKVLMGNKQKVDHPLQAVSNFAGDISGALQTRWANQAEDARAKAMAAALGGMAPAGMDSAAWGALVGDDPESARDIVLKSQMDSAARSAEFQDWQRKKDYEQSLEPAGGPFEGTSVEAQSLNKLIASGAITEDQAAQLGAGKTITTPDGSIVFLTPQGVFGQPAGGGAPVPVDGQPDAQPAPPAQPLPKIGSPEEPAPDGQPALPAPAAVPAQPEPAAPMATPPAASPPANQGVIPITGPKPVKPTDTQRNAASSMDTAAASLNSSLDHYADMVGKTGLAVTPGSEKDTLNTVRQGIMLEAKELFNLGVLNGPDLQLMEKMIYDPVVDPLKEGGVANLPGQAMTAVGMGESAADRAKASVAEMKALIERKKAAFRAANPAAAGGGKPDYKGKYGLD